MFITESYTLRENCVRRLQAKRPGTAGIMGSKKEQRLK